MTPTILEQINKNKHRCIIWAIPAQPREGGGGATHFFQRHVYPTQPVNKLRQRSLYKHYGEGAQLRWNHRPPPLRKLCPKYFTKTHTMYESQLHLHI